MKNIIGNILKNFSKIYGVPTPNILYENIMNYGSYDYNEMSIVVNQNIINIIVNPLNLNDSNLKILFLNLMHEFCHHYNYITNQNPTKKEHQNNSLIHLGLIAGNTDDSWLEQNSYCFENEVGMKYWGVADQYINNLLHNNAISPLDVNLLPLNILDLYK